MTQHTKGPWRYLPAARTVFDADGNEVALVLSTNARSDGAAIAALPELLALLVESQHSIGGDWRDRRDAAIAAATGTPT